MVAEAAAVIASILLAFAIQAWWDDRAEVRIRVATIEGLIDDFEASQRSLTFFRGLNERIETGHDLLINALDSVSAGTDVVVPDSFLIAAVNAPIFEPSRAALDAMVATGRLGLIEDQSLRRLLADWIQRQDLTRNQETAVREIVADLVVPLLSRETSLNDVHQKVVLWSTLESGTPFESMDHVLESSTDLIGALAHRRYRSGFVVRGQADLIRAQEQIISGLRVELTR